MKLSSKSRHYRLASLYGKGSFGSKTDLCTYVRHLFIGVFFWACAVFIGTVLSFVFIFDPLVWIAVCIAEGRFVPMLPLTIFAAAAWTFMSCFVAFCFWAEYRSERGETILPVPETVREAYRGWKEKYCPMVQVEQ